MSKNELSPSIFNGKEQAPQTNAPTNYPPDGKKTDHEDSRPTETTTEKKTPTFTHKIKKDYLIRSEKHPLTIL